jgi:hypothetical protein
VRGGGRFVYLGGGCGTLYGVLAFDSLDPLCFVIDDALDFRLVETIYDGVFTFLDVYYTADDMRCPFLPCDREKRCAPRFT